MSEVTERVTAESSPHAQPEPAPRHSSRAVPSLEVSLSMPRRSSADRGDFRREKPTWFPFLSSSNSSKEGNGPQAFFLTCCQTSISVSSLQFSEPDSSEPGDVACSPQDLGLPHGSSFGVCLSWHPWQKPRDCHCAETDPGVYAARANEFPGSEVVVLLGCGSLLFSLLLLETSGSPTWVLTPRLLFLVHLQASSSTASSLGLPVCVRFLPL